ncbi:MAG TPA: type II 3-dehydroquinate dehydratase [Stellaceae bacterium]|nr:type II 3-dehydroquinate dehydratase [Stellaceae bacterium]
MKLLVVQGATMVWLGKREPEIYGTTTAAELDAMLQRHAEARGATLDIFYTNVEGHAIDRIYLAAEQGIDGMLLNPAGFLHTGFALRDCLRSMRFPCIEVHMSNIDKRGFKSVTAEAATGMITGLGTKSYLVGLDALVSLVGDGQKTG